MHHFYDSIREKAQLLLSWIAAILGLGTVAGIVNISVGLLSALWLVVQLYNYFKYTLPINKAKLQKAQSHENDEKTCETDA